MLGMHGTYEANMAMHDCDVMVCIGARFDDRITGGSMPSRRARRRSTSISTRPRSTRPSGRPADRRRLRARCSKSMIAAWGSQPQADAKT
jgi:hypothetical protein